MVPITSTAIASRRPGSRLSRRTNLISGAVIVGVLIAVALLSLVWTPLPPEKMQIVHKLQPPLAFGLLGTDQFGP